MADPSRGSTAGGGQLYLLVQNSFKNNDMFLELKRCSCVGFGFWDTLRHGKNALVKVSPPPQLAPVFRVLRYSVQMSRQQE